MPGRVGRNRVMADGVEFLDVADRGDWLEKRRGYVTATDVVRLASSAAAWAEIRAEKSGKPGHEIGHLPKVRWGVEREPVLIGYAEIVTGLDLEANNRLVVRDGRYAATPDGLGDDVTVECKTGARNRLEAARRKYLDQLQWQMFVCGASRGLFVTEVRDVDDGDEFVPGDASVEVVHRDEARIAELVAIADRFLAGPDEDWEMDLFVADIRSAKADLEKAQMRVDEAEDAARKHIGDRDYRYSGPSGTLSYTLPQRTAFDRDRLEAENPDLVGGFRRTRSVTELDLDALREAHPDLVRKYESKVPVGKRRLTVREPKSEGTK